MVGDRSYDDFCSSLGVGLAMCTIIVSIGKALTGHYFFYLIFILIITMFIILVHARYTLRKLRATEGDSKSFL